MSAPPMPFLPPEIHGRMIIFAFLLYAGGAQTGEKVLAPFRQIAKPLSHMLRPIRYSEMFRPQEEEYHPLAVGRTLFVDHIGLDESR
jgi:hypothetical protein